jgi:hypothetical protein
LPPLHDAQAVGKELDDREQDHPGGDIEVIEQHAEQHHPAGHAEHAGQEGREDDGSADDGEDGETHSWQQ